jgi:hypothetical protein
MRQPFVSLLGLKWIFQRLRSAFSVEQSRLLVDFRIDAAEVPDLINIVEPLLQIRQMLMESQRKGS